MWLWSLLLAAVVLLSPVDITVQEPRPVFTWTHASATTYVITLTHEDGTIYTFQVESGTFCSAGVCVWQTPVYLRSGTWTWTVEGGATPPPSASFQVSIPSHGQDLNGVILERRMTYDAFVSAAGFTTLGVLFLAWALFDIMRGLTGRKGG